VGRRRRRRKTSSLLKNLPTKRSRESSSSPRVMFGMFQNARAAAAAAEA
jgi:hypothetical protein